jgi:hypothetical protein
VIGYLNNGSPESDAPRLTGLRRGLSETGYVEGRNFVIEYRWAGNQVDRLPALAADLVHLRVAVIVSAGRVATLAAKAATTSIPIVFAVPTDPVQLGLVASLNRPGGNLTGSNRFNAELAAKALALLHELMYTPVSLEDAGRHGRKDAPVRGVWNHSAATRRGTTFYSNARGPTHMAFESPSITQLSQVIAQATAPSFLLGAVAAFISVLIARMNRIIDRSQALNAISDDDVSRASLKADIPRLKRRARVLNRAILYATVSGIATSLLVIMAFVCAFFNLQHEYGVAVLFVVALGFFTMALIALAREGRIALSEMDHYK